MTTNDPRVDKLVDAIYVEGARKNEVSPAFHLDDAINSWVAGIVLRGFDDSGVCGCEDCPSRPEWHRDLDSMFDIVTPLRNRLEATIPIVTATGATIRLRVAAPNGGN